ncbi:metal ABC transporter solute-binding protein, Zn/Mn family [candidate division KSB1 bacterium]
MIRGMVILAFLILANAAAICAQQPLQVAVSVTPQKYFVERIGGDRVRVMIMVPPGSAPNVYEPRPAQMVALAGAEIYFAIGVPFENIWLDKFTSANRNIKMVHTDDGIEKLSMAGHFHGDEFHIDEHAGERAGIPDPHIWLSPQLVKIQAGHILRALIATDMEGRDGYEARYERFIEDIDSLDARLTGIFSSGKSSKEFIVFHPAWGYFAQSYGLRQIPVEIEGKEPKPAGLIELIQYARRQNIRFVFVQPQIYPQSAAMVAREIRGEVITIDPLAEDWLSNMQTVAEKFQAVLKR